LCPYDDPLVIARQGTVRMEILKQVPDAEHLDAIFGAVGGGGLVTGICEYVKRITNPCTRDIGAETFDGDAMARSLDKGDRVTLAEVCNSGREDVLVCRRLVRLLAFRQALRVRPRIVTGQSSCLTMATNFLPDSTS
jgi:threonine dehydratase